MPNLDVEPQRDASTVDRVPIPPPEPSAREQTRQTKPKVKAPDGVVAGRRRRALSFLITIAAVSLALVLARSMWRAYVEAPWTRDATVRAYVVTMAPEVSGRIAELPVTDNQFVHKGDLLMVIDPTDYRIAVNRSTAALQQAQLDAANLTREAGRRERLARLDAVALEQAQIYEKNALVAQTQVQLAAANLHQARVNLERTRIRAPVNGWVTNLLARRDDFATVGQNQISLVDADSFWVDAYFEETKLGAIREGDRATIELMAYRQAVRGHVAGVPIGNDGRKGLIDLVRDGG
jgi:multidrug resistance efflux pump